MTTMKAPSSNCLQALRLITFASNTQTLSHRCFATHVSRLPLETSKAPRPAKVPRAPPPQATLNKPEPPLSSSLSKNPKESTPLPPVEQAHSASSTTQSSPSARIRRPSQHGISHPPVQPGFRQREKSDDDEEFIPRPLSRPIGMPNPPQLGENMGLDNRSLQQRRDDFVNYEKHLERRAKMTKQIAKPYFRDWSNMRFHKGKIFVANDRLFKADVALWFPNLYGRTLRRGLERRNKKDGYRGLGRDTYAAVKGKISVVSFVSNAWAVNQINTFCSPKANPAVQALLEENQDLVQRVEINHENNMLKYWILRLFGMGGLRRERSAQQQERYFIVRRGVSSAIKEAIGLLNDKVGYVYLLDTECKIRWAGSAVAEEREKESMARGLSRLVQETRMARSEMDDTTHPQQKAVEQFIDGAGK